jgi:hypothetical protein
MSFAAITLCVSSQEVFVNVVVSLSTQSGHFWIHHRNFKMDRVICVGTF